jgi:hypothetical protein
VADDVTDSTTGGSDVTPGPADYDTRNTQNVLSDEHKTPAISIGRRTNLPSKTQVPPPNNYDIKFGLGSR